MDTVDFTGNNSNNTFKKIQDLSESLNELDIEAMFLDENQTKGITRTYIEMVLEELSIATQNQALFNKFLQMDTKLEKALREYQADIKALLMGVTNAPQIAPTNQPSMPNIPNPIVTQPQPTPQPAQMQVPKLKTPTSTRLGVE